MNESLKQIEKSMVGLESALQKKSEYRMANTPNPEIAFHHTQKIFDELDPIPSVKRRKDYSKLRAYFTQQHSYLNPDQNLEDPAIMIPITHETFNYDDADRYLHDFSDIISESFQHELIAGDFPDGLRTTLQKRAHYPK